MRLFSSLLVLCSSGYYYNVVAYQPSQPQLKSPPTQKQQQQNYQPKNNNKLAIAAATTALSFLLSTTNPLPALASDTAAQIALNGLPPNSISIQIDDLPVIGSLISGTYTKVTPDSVTNPSIVIKSPKDKIKAISNAATGGHLEFDINGKIKTHLDVDIAADEAGKAKILVSNNLIPKLPYNNMASSNIGGPIGGKESAWSVVTNLGSGQSYYFNKNTGVTQYERPDKIY